MCLSFETLTTTLVFRCLSWLPLSRRLSLLLINAKHYMCSIAHGSVHATKWNHPKSRITCGISYNDRLCLLCRWTFCVGKEKTRCYFTGSLTGRYSCALSCKLKLEISLFLSRRCYNRKEGNMICNVLGNLNLQYSEKCFYVVLPVWQLWGPDLAICGNFETATDLEAPREGDRGRRA